MQRKNNFIRPFRRGFAMIMAIAVITTLATIMALTISLNMHTTKRTVDLYLYEQAAILAKSASEYALLKIAQDGPCSPTSINFKHDSIYDINISLSYIYNVAPAGCSAMYTTVSTPEQNGSVIMDIAVGVSDTSLATEPIRYFRRTIQKL